MTPSQQKKATTYEREMTEEWDSWEWLIKEDLERIEYRIQLCYKRMSEVCIPKEMRERFVLNKLADMIRGIGEGA